MILTLHELAVKCIIGELPKERECEQTILVEVVLEIADETAVHTDELADTIDYASLAKRIQDALRVAKCRLIERAAAVVCETCLGEKKVEAVEVQITKSHCVDGLESAQVNLRMNRRDSR